MFAAFSYCFFFTFPIHIRVGTILRVLHYPYHLLPIIKNIRKAKTLLNISLLFLTYPIIQSGTIQAIHGIHYFQDQAIQLKMGPLQ